MDDLIKTLKVQLYERASSPLLSTFLISWAAWNYRFILALFSKLEIEKTFHYIDEVLYPTWKAILPLFLGPLLSTAFIIYVLPIPARVVYKRVRNEQKTLKELLQKIEDETPITQAEAVALRGDLRKAAASHDKEVTELESVISKLKADIKKLEEVSNLNRLNDEVVGSESLGEGTAKKNGESQKVTLSIDQLNLLIHVAGSGGAKRNKIIASAQDRISTEHNIDVLEKHRFIRLQLASDGTGPTLRATAAGREYIVENTIRGGQLAVGAPDGM